MNNKNIVIGIVVLLALATGITFGVMIAGLNKSCASRPAKPAEGISNVKAKEGPAQAEASKKNTAQGDLLKTKEAYQKMIEKSQSPEAVQKAQVELDNLNIQILFSPVMTPDSESYIVQKGDNLVRIAKKFNTTTELIARSNGLKDSVVRIGQRLKVTKAKFSIAIDKSQDILTLKSNGEIVKTYRVSTGKDMSTPVGAFAITNKIVNPPWYPSGGGMIPAGDPKNVLGSRWLGISKPSYGIHGTTDPESIGKNVTEGCVRLKNSDVEELYAIVPEGTEVVIVD